MAYPTMLLKIHSYTFGGLTEPHSRTGLSGSLPHHLPKGARYGTELTAH
ncbi:hypothetical protein K1F50_15875 [Muricauda oceani]|uniref:Uncharacterized protein n=1 Tax=Flagellimonas oceani TaxID=2698672 RepID=A0A6G7IZT9_9FLAO|nr:hypothetical protein [Allomuricauda oceani]MBW8244288.1 hypothetical protein [Allomuricauda oceani]QII44066.1 hypothetical protein GVT53_05060 [Allomuricauda oceani]